MSKFDVISDNLDIVDSYIDAQNLFNSFLEQDELEQVEQTASSGLNLWTPQRDRAPAPGPDPSTGFTPEISSQLQELARRKREGFLSDRELDNQLNEIARKASVAKKDDRGTVRTAFDELRRAGNRFGADSAAGEMSSNAQAARLFTAEPAETSSSIDSLISRQVETMNLEALDPGSPFRGRDFSQQASMLTGANARDPLTASLRDGDLYQKLLEAKQSGNQEEYGKLLEEATEVVDRNRDVAVQNIQKANERRLAALENVDAIPASIPWERVKAGQDELTALELWGDFPISVALSAMAESGPESGAILASYAVGSIAGTVLSGGNPAGGMAGGTALSGAVGGAREYNRQFVERAMARGVDFSDEESIREFVNDDSAVAEIGEKASQAAVVTGGVAALQTAFASKYLGLIPGGRRTGPGETVNLAVQTALQTAADAGNMKFLQTLDADSPDDIGPALVQSAAGNIGGAAVDVGVTRGIGVTSDLLVEGIRSLERPQDGDLSIIENLFPGLLDQLSQRTETAINTVESLLANNTVEDLETSLDGLAERLAMGDTQLGSLDTIQGNIDPASLRQEQTAAMPDLDQIFIDEGADPAIAQDINDFNQASREAREVALSMPDDVVVDNVVDSIDAAVADFLPNADVYSRQKQQGLQRSLSNITADTANVVGASPTVVYFTDPLSTDGKQFLGIEGRQLLDTLRDKSVPIAERLDALQDAFEKGVVSQRYTSETINPDLYGNMVAAARAGDPDALRFLKPFRVEEFKRALEQGDEAALTNLLGVSWIKSEKGKGASSSNPRSPIGKMIEWANRVFSRWTRAGGAQSPATRRMYRNTLYAQNFIKAQHEEFNRHLKNTKKFFPDNITDPQRKAIQDYMNGRNDTTRAALDVDGMRADTIAPILDKRIKFISDFGRFMIDTGLAQGDFKHAILNNDGQYTRTMYAAFRGMDVLKNLTPELEGRLINFLQNKLNDPIFDGSLPELKLRELKDLAYSRDMFVRVPDEKTGELVDTLNGKTVDKLNRKELIAALQGQEKLSEGALHGIMYNMIARGKDVMISDMGIAQTPSDRSVTVARRQEGMHKKKVLAHSDSEIATLLRDLYGEITHPNDVFIGTVNAMLMETYHYIATKNAIQLALDMGSAVITKEANTKGFTRTVKSNVPMFEVFVDQDGKRERKYVKPDDIRISEEMANLLETAFPDKSPDTALHKMWNWYKAVNGLVKFSLVGLNVPSHTRNYGSGVWYGSRNGYFLFAEPESYLKAIEVMGADVFASTNPENRQLVDMLINHGVSHDGARSSVLVDHIHDVSDMTSAMFRNRGNVNKNDGPAIAVANKITKGIKAVVQGISNAAAEFLRSQDEIVKIHGFFEERAWLADALFSEDSAGRLPLTRLIKNNKFLPENITAQHLVDAGMTPTASNIAYANREMKNLNALAAAITVAVNPTFSQVPPFIRNLRNNPLIAAFPSFASESYRTHLNSARLLGAMMKMASTGKMGDVQLSEKGKQAVATMLSKKAMGFTMDLASREMLRTATAFMLGSVYGGEDYEELMDWAMTTGRINAQGNKASGLYSLGLFLEQNVSNLLPDWLQDNNIAVLDYDMESGSMMYVDYSFLDPSGPGRDSLYTLWKQFATGVGDSTATRAKLERAAYAAMSPFVAAEPIMDFAMNFRSGVSSLENIEVKGADLVWQTAQLVIPNFIGKTWDLLKEKEGGRAVALLGGAKVYEVNVYNLFRARAGLSDSTLNAHKRVYMGDMLNPDDYSMDITDPSNRAFEQAFEQIKQKYADMRALESEHSETMLASVESMRALGQPDSKIRDFIISGIDQHSDGAGVLGRGEINELLDGRNISLPVRSEELQRYIQQVNSKVVNDDQKKAENAQIITTLFYMIRSLDDEYQARGTIDGEELF